MNPKRYDELSEIDDSHLDLVTMNKIIHEITGDSDYAVVFSVWCWPDGGFMAGCILTDKEYATNQRLLAAKLDEYPNEESNWNVIWGFEYGINVHSHSLPSAIRALYKKLKMYKGNE